MEDVDVVVAGEPDGRVEKKTSVSELQRRFSVVAAEGKTPQEIPMNTKFLVSAAAGALLAMSGAAMAQTAVTATTDLNIR